MLEALPDITVFFFDLAQKYWVLITGCSVLAGFLALAIVKRILRVLEIIR